MQRALRGNQDDFDIRGSDPILQHRTGIEFVSWWATFECTERDTWFTDRWQLRAGINAQGFLFVRARDDTFGSFIECFFASIREVLQRNPGWALSNDENKPISLRWDEPANLPYPCSWKSPWNPVCWASRTADWCRWARISSSRRESARCSRHSSSHPIANRLNYSDCSCRLSIRWDRSCSMSTDCRILWRTSRMWMRQRSAFGTRHWWNQEYNVENACDDPCTDRRDWSWTFGTSGSPKRTNRERAERQRRCYWTWSSRLFWRALIVSIQSFNPKINKANVGDWCSTRWELVFSSKWELPSSEGHRERTDLSWCVDKQLTLFERECHC